jgi:hypothetical protein
MPRPELPARLSKHYDNAAKHIFDHSNLCLAFRCLKPNSILNRIALDSARKRI